MSKSSTDITMTVNQFGLVVLAVVCFGFFMYAIGIKVGMSMFKQNSPSVQVEVTSNKLEEGIPNE